MTSMWPSEWQPLEADFASFLHGKMLNIRRVSRWKRKGIIANSPLKVPHETPSGWGRHLFWFASKTNNDGLKRNARLAFNTATGLGKRTQKAAIVAATKYTKILFYPMCDIFAQSVLGSQTKAKKRTQDALRQIQRSPPSRTTPPWSRIPIF